MKIVKVKTATSGVFLGYALEEVLKKDKRAYHTFEKMASYQGSFELLLKAVNGGLAGVQEAESTHARTEFESAGSFGAFIHHTYSLDLVKSTLETAIEEERRASSVPVATVIFDDATVYSLDLEGVKYDALLPTLITDKTDPMWFPMYQLGASSADRLRVMGFTGVDVDKRGWIKLLKHGTEFTFSPPESLLALSMTSLNVHMIANRGGADDS